MYCFDDISMGVEGNLQHSGEWYPDGWFDDVRLLYGEQLSNEMISQSVEETCDFFHIEEPVMVAEGWTTGVYPNNDSTMQDDVLVFNREQLLGMGIYGKDGLDLVMTHEFTHRMVQGLDLGFDAHQEELCCDFMAGVRAGLNGIDVSQLENALMFTEETDSHPAGCDRGESIESGVRFAQKYIAEYNMCPTFEDCLDGFRSTLDTDSFADISIDDESTELTFKGLSQSEIDRRIDKAEKEQRYHESLVRHHLSMAKHGLDTADTSAHLREAKIHENRAQDYAQEALKWKRTKPTES